MLVSNGLEWKSVRKVAMSFDYFLLYKKRRLLNPQQSPLICIKNRF